MVRINQVGSGSRGPKPLMGPDPERAIVVEINGKSDFLEMPHAVAQQLIDAISKVLSEK